MQSAEDERRPVRRWWAAAGLIAIVALAILRVGVLAVRDRTTVFMPDLWETVLGAQAAGHGQQLVGAWSRLGLYHPGPLWFWWAAPFLRLAGDHPAGLALAASTLAAVSIVVAFAAVGERRDGLRALVAATVLAVGVGQLSTQGLTVPWNPTIVILPIAAAIACVAATASRRTTWPAFAAVLLGTLVAQAHLGTLLVGGALVVAALAAWLVQAKRDGGSVRVGHAAALVAVALLPWVPVAVDQVVGVGNATTVARYALTGSVDERFPHEPTGPSADLSVVGAVRALGSITALTEPRTALWAGADLGAGQTHDPSPASSIVALGLVAAAAWTARPERFRRTPGDALAAWTCRVGTAALVLQLIASIKVRHEFRPYLIAGSAGVGLALWLGVALAALHALRPLAATRIPAPRWALVRGIGTATVALVAVVSVGRYAGSIQGYDWVQPGDRQTVLRVRAALDGASPKVEVSDTAGLQPALALTAHLDHLGTRSAVRGRYRSHFSDRQRRAGIDDGTPGLLVFPAGADLPPGCEDLGSFQGAQICLTPAAT